MQSTLMDLKQNKSKSKIVRTSNTLRARLAEKPDILIATPGRLLEYLKSKVSDNNFNVH